MIIIIPARSGSKRLHGKNTMPFNNGKTLVEMAVEQALLLEVKDRTNIVLTTDIPMYLTDSFQNKYGISVIERDHDLCTDMISTEEVVKDVFWRRGGTPYSFLLLQPMPRGNVSLLEAKKFFDGSDIPALVSISPTLRPNGAFYFVKGKDFQSAHSFYPPGTFFWKCSLEEGIDVDYIHDFRIAEAVWRGDIWP